MQEGVGSVWNKGSWHWEEKNHSNWAKDKIKELFQQIKFSVEDYDYSINSVYQIKGRASVAIRKGKQIFLFEFEMDCTWRATLKSSPTTIITGRIRLDEFNQDDDEITFEVFCDRHDEQGDNVRYKLQKNVLTPMMQKVQEFKELFRTVEADREKIKQAHEISQKETEKMKAAEIANSEEKKAIFEQMKKKEQEMKEQAQKNAHILQQQLPKKVDAQEGKGSVWNPNSYFWEEKSVAKWSQDRLRQLLIAFSYKTQNIIVLIDEVQQLKGEASVNIRKGKKLVSFDFQAKVKFSGEMVENENKTIVTGTFTMPEISNDVEDDYTVETNIFTSLTTPAHEKLGLIIKKDVVSKLKELFISFHSELKDK